MTVLHDSKLRQYLVAASCDSSLWQEFVAAIPWHWHDLLWQKAATSPASDSYNTWMSSQIISCMESGVGAQKFLEKSKLELMAWSKMTESQRLYSRPSKIWRKDLLLTDSQAIEFTTELKSLMLIGFVPQWDGMSGKEERLWWCTAFYPGVGYFFLLKSRQPKSDLSLSWLFFLVFVNTAADNSSSLSSFDFFIYRKPPLRGFS